MLFRLILMIITGAVLVLLYGVYLYVGGTDIGDRTVSVIVGEGDSFARVASTLLDEGVVSSEFMLKAAARWREVDRSLTPGRYDFTGNNSVRSVLNRLEAADFLRVKVTVYEGAPIWRVASILQAKLDLDSTRIMSLNSDSAFLARFELPSLEGYLFPETYHFKWGLSDTAIISDMIAMFRRQTDTIWTDSIPLGLSPEEVIILASIVEAEVLLDEERPLVASVYLNRMRDRWRLDADPTVIYGLGGLDRPLTRRDLRQVTPYNTYRRRGLPPTPINSPGLRSIQAVLRPAETDYYFFVADNTGGHRFSRTNAEHNRAIREIRSGGR